MSATFIHLEAEQITPNHKEVFRYLGYNVNSTPDETVKALAEKAIEKMRSIIMPQAVYDFYDLSFSEPEEKKLAQTQNEAQNETQSIPEIQFGEIKISSKYLWPLFKDCKKVCVAACTIGPQVDSLIRRTGAINSALASVMQATGAMFIEEFVDFVNSRIKSDAAQEGFQTKPRYSPGYGDVPLDLQKNIFSMLPCTRIGLSLMQTLIMAPEKSVTAFIGLKKI